MNKQYLATFILPTDGRDVVVDEGVRIERSDDGFDWIAVHPHTSPGTDAIPEGTEVVVSKRDGKSSGGEIGRFTVEDVTEIDVGYLGVVYDKFLAS